MKIFRHLALIIFAALLGFSCSEDDDNPIMGNCTDPSAFIFEEEDSLLYVEFESAMIAEQSDWILKNGGGASGTYGVWEGEQSLGTPGAGVLSYNINIKNPGIYRFIWRSSVTIGNSGTDHNDSWLRFPDAKDFFGEKNGSRVYPKGTGKTPNPNGASAEGWFKVYRSGNNLEFKWQAKTSDNDAHNIYVQFDIPGVYTMEVSARSTGHAIDQFILFQEDQYNERDVIDSAAPSAITCKN